tara:strand:- start:4185 stop:4952 length:768 start_codon:yes stop_codon:yes gene_type:complete
MQAKKTKAELQDNDLLRYNRNIVLPEIDVDGQLALLNAKVAIVGLGGIGCPTATYLTSSGIGQLCLIDFDHVSLSNLNRQVLFTENDISKTKASAAKDRLQSLNSEINIYSMVKKIDSNFDKNLLKEYHYVIDCSDNFETRSIVNEICLENRTPLISGAAIKFQGQVATFRNDLDNMPCYRCLYKDLPNTTPSCLDSGILGSVTGLIGTMLATECVKLICNIGTNFGSKLMLIDMKSSEFKTIKLNKDNECDFCR